MRIFRGIKSGCSSLIGSIANFSEMEIGSRVQTNQVVRRIVYDVYFSFLQN